MNQLFMMPLFTMLNTNVGAKGSETILESDPYGLTVALISISVVLSALIVLGVFIWLFSKVMIFISKRQFEQTKLESMQCPKSDVLADAEFTDNGEVIAAIALALKLNKEALHDRESEIITINSVARAYSPWSSKIHGLTNMPR